MVNVGPLGQNIRALRGEEMLLTKDDKGREHLNVFLFLRIQCTFLNQMMRDRARSVLGDETFRQFAQDRYCTITPFLLGCLREECVHDVETYIEFIVDGAVVAGLSHEKFIGSKELHALRRTAHLRAARHYQLQLDSNFGQVARLTIACAVLAGVTPEEIGIDEPSAKIWIDKHLYRASKETALKNVWKAYEERNNRFNELAA